MLTHLRPALVTLAVFAVLTGLVYPLLMTGIAQVIVPTIAEGDEEARPLISDYPGTSRSPMWWEGRVYFLCDESGVINVWSMAQDGSDRKQLTKHTEWDIKNASLSAGRIVYSQGADLRIFEIATGEDRALRFTLSSDFDQQRDRWITSEYAVKATINPVHSQRKAVTRPDGRSSLGRCRCRRYTVPSAATGSRTSCARPPHSTIATGEAKTQ